MNEEEFTATVLRALGIVEIVPKDLGAAIRFAAVSEDPLLNDPLPKLVSVLLTEGPNSAIRHALSERLHRWDHQDPCNWSPDTEMHSKERRLVALRRLGFADSDFESFETTIPRFTSPKISIVIVDRHEEWYEAKRPGIRAFYWDHYKKQLLPPIGKWSSEAADVLELSTDDVVSRLSDPTRNDLCQVKGLVMGYVQSGKTSHFSGLIAKAADAGYRLVIVLAGTMDILRQQTQRRIDKDIVGKELLGIDEYGNDAQWGTFVSHGGKPSELGYFDWDRLTGKTDDYTALRQHLTALSIKKLNPALSFNHPENLRPASARLVVIKKTPSRLNRFRADLERLKALRNALEEIPTLVIDDESDQASVNTVNRKKGRSGDRTSTNRAIADLLRTLPRAQYVGYTATPFANVFIDPEDVEDLFPRHFIVSLPRPEGYMGARDFYDLDEELDRDDPRSNEGAYVRDVIGEDTEDGNLPQAVDSFVIAGAIKLFRAKVSEGALEYPHHTMLVHHSPRKAAHAVDAQIVTEIFREGVRYQRAHGIAGLEKLFNSDFRRISAIRAEHLPFPDNFATLKPYITECIAKICYGKSVLIVNGDNKDDTPNFDEIGVWAILVGGAKLSRGYTIEGLTTSYFRRPTGAGDTLMQMGRWFGFRSGYSDLVRLYVGRREKRGRQSIDLYEAFGAICQDEEALRRDLLRYSKGGITPKQVPPLVHQHMPLMPPTARNKMFNARIQSIDFSGEWSEKTITPTDDELIGRNRNAARDLLSSASTVKAVNLEMTSQRGDRRSFDAHVGVVDLEQVVVFLRTFEWAGNRKPTRYEEEFIAREAASQGMRKWLVVAPVVSSQEKDSLGQDQFPPLTVIARKRVLDRFKVFSEPRHRDVAAHLAGATEGAELSGDLQQLGSTRMPVILIYLVRDKDRDAGPRSIGFAIQFGGQKKARPVTWSVADPTQSDAVTVSSNVSTEARASRGGC